MCSNHLTAVSMLAAVVVAAVAGAEAAQQPARTAPARASTTQKARSDAPSLPPLSYVCPMPNDADVLEDQPGNCPKCGMKLQPIRLDLRYACPVHQTYVQDAPGTHPYDGRELVPVTVSVFWTCGEQRLLEPGTCADGSARKERYEQRPHGDHNPKHGGQFFMAPDAWHHLEGTYPRTGVFRLYFYNDYSKPLMPKGFTATVSVLDAKDQEVVANLPLKPGRISNTMEATIPAASRAFPVRLLARVKFTPTSKGDAFNFTFPAITKEPIAGAKPPVTTQNNARPSAAPATATAAAASGAAGRATAPASPSSAPATPAASGTAVPAASASAAPSSAPSTTAAAAAPAASSASTSAQTAPMVIAPPAGQVDLSQAPAALLAALDETSLPQELPGLLAELDKRAGDVAQMVQEGNLGQVWLPAMGTKTVALVLEQHAAMLPESQRAVVSAAVKRVVTSAWELDAYGDLGNKPKMTEAYDKLAAAVTQLKAVYGSH
jgi:hypothetical protein